MPYLYLIVAETTHPRVTLQIGVVNYPATVVVISDFGVLACTPKLSLAPTPMFKLARSLQCIGIARSVCAWTGARMAGSSSHRIEYIYTPKTQVPLEHRLAQFVAAAVSDGKHVTALMSILAKEMPLGSQVRPDAGYHPVVMRLFAHLLDFLTIFAACALETSASYRRSG